MSFVIKSSFINDFNLGDNINHNLEILSSLYAHYNKAGYFEQNRLRKPIIIIIVSIIEAVLYDFHERIKKNIAEGVVNLKESVVEYIRGKEIDKFKRYIESAKKHNFFAINNDRFYDYLIELCKLRNRIHIQNTRNDFEAKERDVFTEKRMFMAEKALEFIFKKLLEKYPRDEFKHHVDDFHIPWEERFGA